MTVWLRSTGSTMKDAAVLAARDEPHGTVVVADEQTAGIGRQGHSWHSEAGAGLYCSIILRLALPAESLPILTMALGLGVQRAINDTCGVSCDIRWPNDLLLNEKKLAGIMVTSADRAAMIAGIGLNVNQTVFPEDLRSIATSLRLETGREQPKETLLDQVVAECLRYAARTANEGTKPILKEFERCSTWVRGKWVSVEAGGRLLRGVTAGLDEYGFLKVETENGIETIVAGGVRPLA